VLEGPGLQQVAGFAGESTHFMVACFKEGGGEFDHFVVSNLIVEITGPATLEPTVAATKIGAKVSYTARKAGNYSISIKYFGDDLPGSPMPVSILAGERQHAPLSILPQFAKSVVKSTFSQVGL
jgi:hypothetical protein